MVIPLVGALLTTTDAAACNVAAQRASNSSEFITRMLAERNKPCRSTQIDATGIIVIGGGVVENPRRGKVVVLPDPGYEYVSNQAGPDNFVIAFYGRDRTEQPVSIMYRVAVEVADLPVSR